MCHRGKLPPCRSCKNYTRRPPTPSAPARSCLITMRPMAAHKAHFLRSPSSGGPYPYPRLVGSAFICAGPRTGDSLTFSFPKQSKLQRTVRSGFAGVLWERTCFPPDPAPLAEPQAALCLMHVLMHPCRHQKRDVNLLSEGSLPIECAAWGFESDVKTFSPLQSPVVTLSQK